VIGIVDYGMGNRRSVEKALEHVGARVVVSADRDVLLAADGLVVPGVGAFPRAMENLERLGLAELIRSRVAAGTPTLGICLGMQLAFESSTELGGAAGLGLVPGTVERLDAGTLKLPHIGWNAVDWRAGSPMLEGVPSGTAFYHVHTFAPRPAEASDVLGSSSYGTPFVTAVARGSFYGVQFHPEKSSQLGLRLLGNFVAICSRAARAAAA
jgi:imidazole glycerol-phosphate synthase subunit HisH